MASECGDPFKIVYNRPKNRTVFGCTESEMLINPPKNAKRDDCLRRVA